MPAAQPSIPDIVRQRYSCRTYATQPIDKSKQEQLLAFIQSLPSGPFGSQAPFDLVAARDSDRSDLRGLGTYGFIRNAPGFIVGVSTPVSYHLEDYGYLMEVIILYATALGLGTCWLGGTFTKSSFARKINLSGNEEIPAVAAIGEIAHPQQKRKGMISQFAGASRRLPWGKLFFNYIFSEPLLRWEAGEYTLPLEMLRLAPSASNKQPWRVISYNQYWRFYLQRTPGYRKDPIKLVLGLCDLQRLDMGIAMCHFELTAKELGLKGEWVVEETLVKYPYELTKYVVSWVAQDK